MMDAIIGRYRARMEETGLILRHASGINFDMTVEETLGFLDFISAYKQTLLSLCECETDPCLERIVLAGDESPQGVIPMKG